MLDSYLHALLAVVHSQLQADRQHDGGLEGLLQLLQEVPVVRRAVRAHAQERGLAFAPLFASGRRNSAGLPLAPSLRRSGRRSSAGGATDGAPELGPGLALSPGRSGRRRSTAPHSVELVEPGLETRHDLARGRHHSGAAPELPVCPEAAAVLGEDDASAGEAAGSSEVG